MDENELFSYTKVIANYGLIDIINWFEQHPIYQFKFIIDREADEENMSLQERMSYYPGVKMIGIVTNPWARMFYCYNLIQKDIESMPEEIVKKIDINTFEEFIFKIPYNEKIQDHLWFKFGTNQIEWLTYTDDDGNKKEVDFLLRAENLENDFNTKIKDYLKDNKEFIITSVYPEEYKNLYSNEMKTKVEEVFYQDIEYFKYKF